MKKLPKALRIIIWIALSITGLFVLLFAIENWRGAKAWQATHDRLVANNITLDLAELAPKPTPDETNFYTTPLLSGIEFSENHEKAEFLESLTLLDGKEREINSSPSIEKRTFGDFSELAEALELADGRAQAVYDEIETRFGEQLKELETAARRPNAQTKIDWAKARSFVELSALELPHYHTAMHLQRLLRIRALAAIQIGDGEAAINAMRPQFRFAQATASEPLLIGNLVLQVHLSMLQTTIWEGLARETWNVQQLQEIEAELRRIDLLEQYGLAMQGELCFQVGAIDFLKRADAREWAKLSGIDGDASGIKLGWWCPTGWFDQNKSLGANWVLDSAILPAQKRDLKALVDAPEWDSSNRLHPYRLVVNIMIPALESISIKVAHRHLMLEMTKDAISLEIGKQETGNYPAEYRSKTPDFDDAPLRYATTPNGRYMFYSIGWNQTDDNAEVAFRAVKKDRPKLDEGDWVWDFTVLR
ncbi:MAG: hypothetical protein AAF585_23760 [Verrucomicrobiota bacterium]